MSLVQQACRAADATAIARRKSEEQAVQHEASELFTLARKAARDVLKRELRVGKVVTHRSDRRYAFDKPAFEFWFDGLVFRVTKEYPSNYGYATASHAPTYGLLVQVTERRKKWKVLPQTRTWWASVGSLDQLGRLLKRVGAC